jgi:hypothetical protein
MIVRGGRAPALAVLLALLLAVGAQAQDELPRPLLGAETLVRDISTAGFYELVTWLEGLGLSTQGDRATLARRLYEHYGIEPPPADAEEETPLVVDSAARTRYFTLDEIEESYVRLSGGVTLTLRDAERGVTHQIVADEITYNQETDVLSASGDVIYTLDRDGTVEQFTGEALTVQLESWEGAFVRGVTERTRSIEGEDVDFSFAGSYITRSAEDVVVMEDGRVTSSVADPPNYEIRARKIWVLAPGEWGLRNAYLYVGRVPVFYFPFFFRPGNELFFNPAVGARDRSGGFVQTTTYIRGQPDEPESAFSFLQIAEEQQERGRQRIEGLYLVPDDASSPEAADLAPSADDTTIRILGDIYTKLGAYVALDGTLPTAGPFTNLDFYAGLGVSRHIYRYSYAGRGTTYSPYLVVGDDYLTSWNSTQIGPVRVPFRFGGGFAAGLSGDIYSLGADFTVLSDGSFYRDFDQRSEQIDWLGLLGQGTPVAQPGRVSSYEWSLRGRVGTRLEKTQPWLERLELQSAAIALRFRERSLLGPDVSALNLSIPEELELYQRWVADGSPETGFFYPDVLELPTLTGLVSGTLLDISSGGSREPVEENEREEIPLRPPWEEPGPFEEPPEATFRLPARPGTLPPPAVPELWSASARYTLTPTVGLEHVFDSDGWQDPADVDYSLGYSAASARVSGSLPVRGSVFSGIVSLSSTFGGSGQYRTVFNRGDSVPDATWASLNAQSFSYTSANATSNNSVGVTPFAGSPLWSRSSFSYSINLLLLQTAYLPPDGSVDVGAPGFSPAYDTSFLEWSDEFIRAHQLQATAALDMNSGHSLRVTADLPPRQLTLSGQLDLGFDPVSLSIGGGALWFAAGDDAPEPAPHWEYQPISSTQRLLLGELGRIQNQLAVDLVRLDNSSALDSTDPADISFNRTTATVGPVTGLFELRQSRPYSFGGPGVGWEELTAEELRLRRSRAELSVNLDRTFDPVWRNRMLIGGRVRSAWSMNLLRFTESSFLFAVTGTLEITDFLTLELSSESVNSQSYVYIGSLAEQVGRERRSLIGDLARSFNFFSRQDRIESGFNLQQIRINATHDLEDWELLVSYSGRPEAVQVRIDPIDVADPVQSYSVYEWQSRLDIVLQWKAIRELRTNLGADNQRGQAELLEAEGATAGDRPPTEWGITFGDDS